MAMKPTPDLLAAYIALWPVSCPRPLFVPPQLVQTTVQPLAPMKPRPACLSYIAPWPFPSILTPSFVSLQLVQTTVQPMAPQKPTPDVSDQLRLTWLAILAASAAGFAVLGSGAAGSGAAVAPLRSATAWALYMSATISGYLAGSKLPSYAK